MPLSLPDTYGILSSQRHICCTGFAKLLLKGVVSKRKLAPLTRYISLRLSKKEAEALNAYCAQNGITNSQYFRSLLCIHLGFEDDLQILRLVEPRLKNTT